MADYCSITAEALNLTRSMLQSAQAAQWEKVQELEKHRQALLKQLSTSGLPGDRPGKDAAANLEEIVALNALLIDLGVHARSDMEKMMGLVQRGRKANLAYSGMR